MKALKPIIKHSEASQRSMKINISLFIVYTNKLIFILIQLSEMHAAGRVKDSYIQVDTGN